MTTNETGSRGWRRPLRSALGVGVVAAGTIAARSRQAGAQPAVIATTGSTLNDVKAFGALGDGVTDDRAAIQAAIDDSEASDVDRVAVRDNDVTVSGTGRWTVGVQVAASEPHNVGDVSVVGNTVHGAETGVRFAGGGFLRTPVCGLNQLGLDVATALNGLPALPEDALVVGGAVSRGGAAPATGGGRVLAGLGVPTDRVEGNVGDVFQRLDGDPGPKLFVKESGDATTDGWAAK